MVTLPARPLTSASEWFVSVNFTWSFFFASSVNRIPDTSMYFWSGLVLAPGLAAGLSTLAGGVAVTELPPPRKYPTAQYTAATRPTKANANSTVRSQVGSPAAPRGRCPAYAGRCCGDGWYAGCCGG